MNKLPTFRIFFALISFLTIVFLLPGEVDARVLNDGVLFASQNASLTISARKRTYPQTYAAAFTALTGDARKTFVTAVTSTTRAEEIVVGGVSATGTLQVTRCTGGACDTAGEFSTNFLLSTTSVGTTTVSTRYNPCDATEGGCWRAFDIAVESMSGDIMIANGNTANDGIIFYTMWDGSATTTAAYTFKSGSVSDTRWVRLVSDRNTDRILLLVADQMSRLFAAIWDGSSFGNLKEVTNNFSTNQMPFDGAFESLTGNALVVVGAGTTTATNAPYYYITHTYGGAWDSSTTTVGTQTATCDGATSNSIGRWVELDTDPYSDRIAGLFIGSGTTNPATTPNSFPVVWKGDGSTAGFTFATGAACEEATETQVPHGGDVAWLYNSGTPKALYAMTPGSTGQTQYSSWTQAGGFTNKANITGSLGDDAAALQFTDSIDNGEAILLGTDCDDLLWQNQWNSGIAAWRTFTSTALTVVPATTGSCSAGDEQYSFAYADIIHSPFSKNWRWYAGTDTTDTPTTALAAENATSTGIDGYNQKLRLRFLMNEKGGTAATSTRRDLQYTTTNPNGAPFGITWTDVDEVSGSGLWRYVDCNSGSATICNDGYAVAATVLTGATTAGWWNVSGTASASTTMTLSASASLELEFPIEANGAATGTTYYFRMGETGTGTPIYRLQTTTPCAGSTVCFYPELKTATSSFTQSAFRLFDANDGTDVGSALVAQDTSATLGSVGASFRLRVLLHTATAGLGVNRGEFKLQYVGKGAGTCASPSGGTPAAYTDVTTGTLLAYKDNATPTDGSALTANGSDPTHNADTVVAQSYEEANNFTNPSAIPAGQDGLWDFSLFDNGGTGGQEYCFRILATNGDVLTYDVYPSVTISAGNPTITQLHYRWRDDNGNEENATNAAAEDTALNNNLFPGDRRRLRLVISNAGTATTGAVPYKLESASSTDGYTAWVAVPTSPNLEHWAMDSSTYFVNGTTTVHNSGVTAAPGKSFVTGYMMSTSNQTTAITLSTTEYTEVEYSIRSTSNISTGTTYKFRVTNAGSTTNFTYTVYPQVTVSAVASRPTGGGPGQANGEGNGSGTSQGGGSQGGGNNNGGGEGGGGGTPVGGGGSGGGGGSE